MTNGMLFRASHLSCIVHNYYISSQIRFENSTGFSTGGATNADIELFAKHTTNGKKIKAAGGIASIEDAEDFINLGASRLGTSRIVKIVKNEQGSGY